MLGRFRCVSISVARRAAHRLLGKARLGLAESEPVAWPDVAMLLLAIVLVAQLLQFQTGNWTRPEKYPCGNWSAAS